VKKVIILIGATPIRAKAIDLGALGLPLEVVKNGRISHATTQSARLSGPDGLYSYYKCGGAVRIISKPSSHSVAITLDRLEASLKERGFMIFTRIDHAAAAASVGLKMPASTVLIFGNPRLGTPSFLKQPTLAIDLPLKALVYQDASGKVVISYNSSEYIMEKPLFPAWLDSQSGH
jgi:uncharacterized protein (DUF302 family)